MRRPVFPLYETSACALAGVLLLACAPASEAEVSAAAEALVYGHDDRVDLFQEPDTALRAQVAASAFALIEPHNLRFDAQDRVRVVAAPLRAQDDYCPGTPFLEQPTAATCSATLIDTDLVLTAAHCVRGMNRCRDFAFVSGYARDASARLLMGSRADVYGCRALVVKEKNPLLEDALFDFAVIQLDRAASGPPVEVRTEPLPSAGDALRVVGFPQGLPVKIDSGAVLDDPRAERLDSFTLTSDTFGGSSGSGVFDDAHALVGAFSLGTGDFVRSAGCTKNRELDARTPSREAATYAPRIIDALCARGWPSQRLCGRAPSCGDAVCSVTSEDPTSCPADCAQPRCGDRLCERAEWESCAEDCGDQRPDDVPDGWYCAPEVYADGTCDCECGVTDPDCGSAADSCERVGPTGFTPEPRPAAASCSAAWGTDRERATPLWHGLWLGGLICTLRWRPRRSRRVNGR